MTTTPITDRIVEALRDAYPLDDTLSERLEPQLSASGARILRPQVDAALHARMLRDAVKSVVLDQMVEVDRCEIVETRGALYGVALTGRAVRVDLDRDRTLVAALWCDDGRTAATAGGFSWLSDAYLVDERQRVVCSGREPVALAATVCALRECGARRATS